MTPSDRFSISRTLAIYRLYSAAMLRQTTIYPIISLLLGLITIFSAQSGAIFFMLPLSAITLAIMLILGPIVFTYDNGIEFITALPARGSEKVTFHLLYTFLTIPILTITPFAVTQIIGKWEILYARPDLPLYIHVINTFILSNLPYIIIVLLTLMGLCLLAATAIRRHTTMLTILTIFAANIVLGISTIIMLMIMLKDLARQNLIGHSVYHVDTSSDLFSDMLSFFSDWQCYSPAASLYRTGEIITLSILFVAILITICHKISNRQL